MTDVQGFALVAAGCLVAPFAGWRLSRAGPRAAAAAIALGFLGLAPFALVRFFPAPIGNALDGTDWSALYPIAGGIPAVALLAALAARTDERNRRAVLAFSGVVAAFSMLQATYLLRDPAARLDTYRAGHWQGDCYMQSTLWTCAPSSACSLLRAVGVEATEGEMARLMGTRERFGTNILGIQRGLSRKLRGKGWRAVIHSPSYEELVAAGRRGIVSVKLTFLLDHAVALVRGDAQGVEVLDPASGPQRYSRERFLEIWRGDAVLLEPAPPG